MERNKKGGHSPDDGVNFNSSKNAPAGFFENITEATLVVSSIELDIDEKLWRLLELALKQLGAERGSIMMLADSDSLVVRSSTIPGLIGVSQPLGANSAASLAARERRVMTASDIWPEGPFPPHSERGYKTDNFLAYPVTFQNEVVGVINVTDRSIHGGFDDFDLALLSTFAGVISSAIVAENIKKERDELKAAHEELDRLQKFRDQLTNMIIHDLKGPVGEIMGNLDMLGSYVSDDLGREMLDTAASSAEELMRMIMNILDVSRMEEGRFHIYPEEINITELVKEYIQKLEKLAENEGKTVLFNPGPEPLKIEGDKEALSRVLWNLFSNANNHTGPGGRIEAIVAHEETGVRISVSDDGAGIPAEDIERIFDRFNQSGARPAKYSSGLGLTFCKMAVEAHGGGITVTSEPGGGSTFNVLLPS